jgi:hypothetical protein
MSTVIGGPGGEHAMGARVTRTVFPIMATRTLDSSNSQESTTARTFTAWKGSGWAGSTCDVARALPAQSRSTRAML